MRFLVRSLGVTLVVGGLFASTTAAGTPRLVVDGVGPGWAAQRAGVHVGDILVGAELPTGRRIALSSAFDVRLLELEEGVQGPVIARLRRDGTDVRITVPPGRWGLFVRPILDEAGTKEWGRASAMLAAGDAAAALEAWKGLIDRRRERHGKEEAELWLRVAQSYGDAHLWAESSSAFEFARNALPSGGDGLATALIAGWQSEASYQHAPLDIAERNAEQAVRLLTAGPSHPLVLADGQAILGAVRVERGRAEAAEEPLSSALRIVEKAPLAVTLRARVLRALYLSKVWGRRPGGKRLFEEAIHFGELSATGSRELANAWVWKAVVQSRDGGLAEAEASARRSSESLERLAPGSVDLAKAWSMLGSLLNVRGELAGGEAYTRRAVAIVEAEAPSGLTHADLLDNLAMVLMDEGDLAGADRAMRRSREIFEALFEHAPMYAISHSALIAAERADWETAERLRRESVDMIRAWDPELHGDDAGAELAGLALALLHQGRLDEARAASTRAMGGPPNIYAMEIHGQVLEAAGDLEGAESAYRQAAERMVNTHGLFGAIVSVRLGGLALRKGEIAEAERHFGDAEKRLSAEVPGTRYQAQALYGLGRVRRAQERLEEAVELMRRAVDAVEAQADKLGGPEGDRSQFRSTFRDCYREYVELLVQTGRIDEAFLVSERYRARGLLAMLAERDIVFSADLPADLEREWKTTEAEYARMQAQLSSAALGSGEAQIDGLRDRLRVLGERKDEVKRRIREASPRLAALRYPQPLAAAEAAGYLDADSAMLSFIVGRDRTYVNVVRKGQPLRIVQVPTGEEPLRRRIAELGHGIRSEADGQAVMRASHDLYRALFDEVMPLLAKTKRLLIVPDGPLHTLPFAALVTNIRNGRPEYLVERFALHSVVSATVYAEIESAKRPEGSEKAVAAFGDPAYPHFETARADRLSLANLRSAVRSANGLSPLPFSRSEVDTIAKLYPEDAQVFIGDAATEEHAKEAAKGARYLHFACHGLLDENSPINSGLVLTVPPDPKEGEDDGILQAWEIIEKVRLDADLVTLSACETGLGKEEGGEGLVGLTRAFQYAGARAVLASLWSVSDESTADLMARFYRHLKSGASKADALRAAQLEMIHGTTRATSPQTRDIGGLQSKESSRGAHPFRWAAFQLIGDGH